MPAFGFQTFGTAHLVALGVTAGLPILLATLARRRASERLAVGIGYVLAGVLAINEVIYWGYRLAVAGFGSFLQDHLPLHVCGVAVWLTIAALVLRHEQAYEVAYCWGLVGSLNAVITPGGLTVDFPEYRFFQYFVSHSGIVVGVLYATLGLQMRPTLGGLVRAFLWLQVLATAVGIVNTLTASNYMFLSKPPSGTVSPFFFAPWPWYLPILDLLALGFFFLALSPFALSRWWSARCTGGTRNPAP